MYRNQFYKSFMERWPDEILQPTTNPRLYPTFVTVVHHILNSSHFSPQTDDISTTNSIPANSATHVLNILQNITSKANQSSNLNKRSQTEFFLINYRLGQDHSKHAAAATAATTAPVSGLGPVGKQHTVSLRYAMSWAVKMLHANILVIFALHGSYVGKFPIYCKP
jgi:hypothetical protein